MLIMKYFSKEHPKMLFKYPGLDQKILVHADHRFFLNELS